MESAVPASSLRSISAIIGSAKAIGLLFCRSWRCDPQRHRRRHRHDAEHWHATTMPSKAPPSQIGDVVRAEREPRPADPERRGARAGSRRVTRRLAASRKRRSSPPKGRRIPLRLRRASLDRRTSFRASRPNRAAARVRRRAESSRRPATSMSNETTLKIRRARHSGKRHARAKRRC